MESENRAQQGQLTGEDVRTREELQRQIEAEEETQRQREAELEAERRRAAEEAQQQAMAHQTATAVIEAAAVAASTPTRPPTPTSAPSAIPTVEPTPEPPAAQESRPAVEESGFVDPTEVDSPPAVLKKSPVTWSRAAILSRRKGVVVLQTTVNASGLVDDVKVLRADHEGFGIPQAVMDAVMKYRFKPASRDGMPVTTYYSIVAHYDFSD